MCFPDTSAASCAPGRSSIGSLSAPTVMPVRSSRVSTGLVEDRFAQAAANPASKMTEIIGIRMYLIIPGRELEPIMSYQLHAIILSMNKIGPNVKNLLWAFMALAALIAAPVQRALADEIASADRVVVHKAEHKLYLYSGRRLLGEYKVQLGLSPSGQKEREHDFRTPEGRYFLTRRNTRSDYFLAIQVSYPNKEDEARAHAHRWAPGGLIMIHGLP